MLDNDTPEYESYQQRAAERGKRPALIESFGIRGLYGYRTISLSSNYSATVLIAKNGTGKTTLIGVMDAFLRLQLNRLRNIEFSEIFCKLRGVDEEVVLTNDDLLGFLEIPKEGDLYRLAGRTSVSTDSLFDFLLGDYERALTDYFEDEQHSQVTQKIITAFEYSQSKAIKACTEVYDTLFSRSPAIKRLNQVIRTALADLEIVYLPTYRRVELALTEEGEDRRGRRKSKPKIRVAAGSLHTGNIQFGLSDIQDRLAELNRNIIVRSNRGYREISENIINELIRGYEVGPKSALPTVDDLKLFFGRLESGSRVLGPYHPVTTPDLDKIYNSEALPGESQKFLSYFLGKLAGIIDITKEIEEPVHDFVLSCNKYLSSSEPTTQLPDEAKRKHLSHIDAKAIRINRTDLSVYVESVAGSSTISLDALSSGEKQMISLFAKLYLYPKRKVVLIDEPELSLSIDWQRGILVDVLMAPTCEQVIAITHSPFVFDNALEPFARSLRLTVKEAERPSAEQSMTSGEGENYNDLF